MAKAPAHSFFRANGLSLTLMVIFLLCLAGQWLSGWAVWNHELLQHGRPAITLFAYTASAHFFSATFENWESEFLQMAMYVLLTVWLRQRGSAESRPLDPAEEHEQIDPGPKPWPLRVGGVWRALYARSLSIALFALFAAAFVGHALGSWSHENALRSMQGESPVAFPSFMVDAQFWFESLQNWQSEFLAVLALVVLSIFLRQDKSPESKPLEAPHAQTGR
jgi:hypothetical protein